MPNFEKASAAIYIRELRERYDSTVVPMFPPDTAVDVGDFGEFVDGQWVRHGSLRDRQEIMPEPNETPIAPFSFASSDKFEFGPSVEIPKPGGGTLLEATMKFSEDRAVAVSFQGGVERSHPDRPVLERHLLALWYGKRLGDDLAVVWKVRRAAGGTLVVSQDGGTSVSVRADAAVLGAAGLSLAGMSAGVAFTHESNATWKLSTEDIPLTTSMWLLRLDPKKREAVDGFGFEASDADIAAATRFESPEQVTSGVVLAQLESD